jgi:DNA-binding NarL/FixJ family response regulator
LADLILRPAWSRRYFTFSTGSGASPVLGTRSSTFDLEQLTPREREILQLVAEGHTNRTMSERLGLSAKTVDVHRTNVMRKLDLHSAPALTRFAIRRGLVDVE